MTKLLTFADAADLLSVSTKTISRYCQARHLNVVHLPGGRKRLTMEEIDRFIGKLNPSLITQNQHTQAGLARHGLN